MTHGMRIWWSMGMAALVAAPAMAFEEDAATELPGGVMEEAVRFTEPAADEAPPVRVSMEFQDASLKEVLKAFSQQTGINVIAGPDVEDVAVTLYLEDVTVLDALDQILRAGHLTYERPLGSDIYIVSKQKEGADVKRITRVYQLKYARVSKSILAGAQAALIASTPFEAQKAFEGTGGAGGGGGSGGGGGGGGGGTSIATTKGVDDVIRDLLTKEHGSLVVDGRTNRLIITDVADNFPRVEAALAALDVRTPQIMVDAELIETTITKLKDLGFEWGTGSGGTLFKLTPAKAETKFPFQQFFGEPESGIGGEGLKRRILSGTAAVADTQLTLGTLDTSQAIAVLNALQKDTDSKILARPKVLTLDNESALIRLTTEEAIGFKSTTGQQTATTTSDVERTTTGVILVVTPQINEDGHITMLVEPTVTKTVLSSLTPPSSQGTAIKDPRTRSTRVLVRIRSGETLVVGGLIDRSEETSLRQVPVLSGIPFLGEAFKNQDVNNVASELIVFITPRVLDEPEAERLAASGQTPMGLREQEPSAAKPEAVEERLNVLEKEQRL